jgi:hypothetical protein
LEEDHLRRAYYGEQLDSEKHDQPTATVIYLRHEYPRCRARQHRLHTNAFVGQFEFLRLAECKNESLRTTVNAGPIETAEASLITVPLPRLAKPGIARAAEKHFSDK